MKYDIAYSNKNYHVVILKAPIYDEKSGQPPFSYGLYNIRTTIVESFSTYLPGAIVAADSLSDKLEELVPSKEESVIELMNPSGKVIDFAPAGTIA